MRARMRPLTALLKHEHMLLHAYGAYAGPQHIVVRRLIVAGRDLRYTIEEANERRLGEK